ncbi:helix-turn-helix domain-containing protein [Mitsuokella jalaludinii]|uniref:helix-turn-helix domain-containing protein n=1 Tax=Mitsuokella jalaludinii TaxID=187979 RepID=UPI003079782D
MKTSAEKLKMLRELKGMSQADCAKALGLDRTTYVKYENGGSVRRNVEKLARFFRVSTDYLLGNTDNPVRPYAEMDQDEMNEPVQEIVTLRDKYGRLRKDKSVPVYSKDTLDKSIACAKKLIEEAPLPAPAQPPAQKPELNARDERDIQKKLQSILDDLDPDTGLAFYNGQKPMDNETRDLIRSSIENSLRTAKQLAKTKYTPKKYRNE